MTILTERAVIMDINIAIIILGIIIDSVAFAVTVRDRSLAPHKQSTVVS